MNTKSVSSKKNRKKRYKKTRLWGFVTFLQVLILIGISAAVGITLGTFINMSGMLPKIGDIEAPEATIIYSSDGIVLARIYREDRTNVKLADVPQDLRLATVAIEDSRFYEHSGVDMRGIARAVWQNMRGHRMAQGGSTITQQLARNVYLTQKKTIERKAQEAALAVLIERNFSKEKILEAYLNRVYYGSGAFGVEAASRVYFGKEVSQLNLSECALLAGLPQRPSGYSPQENLTAAVSRRDHVLNRMAELGKITPQERDQAKAERPDIIPERRQFGGKKASHFVDYVTKQLRQRYGDDVLFSSGMKVYTTLSYEMQTVAEDALRNGVKNTEARRKITEGCFVALEPETGYIRAMVGSVDPASQFNRCTQGHGRQPGSAFKAFVYTAAFEAGMSPSDRIEDSRDSYSGGGGKVWRPRNYDDRYRGMVSIRTAVAQSINTVAVKVAQRVGIKNVIKYAKIMGIKSDIEPYLSSAIGGVKGVHALEMASAYGTFANDGVYVEPCAIVKITNGRGDTIDDYQPEGRRAISQSTNKKMNEVLRAVVTSGSGRTAGRVSGACGKTGTTNNDRDAWFIGYVPHKLVAACWVGNDNYAPMNQAYGGKVCAPIWRDFMLKCVPIYDAIQRSKATATAVSTPQTLAGADSQKPVDAAKSASPDVTSADAQSSDMVSCKICDVSGQIAGSTCPSYHIKRFIKGTEPTERCAVHSSKSADTQNQPAPAVDVAYVAAKICPESGQLAGPNCPHPVVRRLPIDEVPTSTCSIHGGGR